MNQNRHSLACRTAETQQVMNWIKARQSGYVLDLRGTGKSNFRRFLLRKDTQRDYLGHACTDFLFVLIDLLSLIERTEWAACKLVLNRLSVGPTTLIVCRKGASDITGVVAPGLHDWSLLWQRCWAGM